MLSTTSPRESKQLEFYHISGSQGQREPRPEIHGPTQDFFLQRGTFPPLSNGVIEMPLRTH